MNYIKDKAEEIERELEDYVYAFHSRKQELLDELNCGGVAKRLFRPEDFEELRIMARIDQNFQIRSHRKRLGQIIVFLKKAVRRLLQWHIDSIVHQQNQINTQIITFFEQRFYKMSNALEDEVKQSYENMFNEKITNMSVKLDQISEETRLIKAQLRKIRYYEENITNQKNETTYFSNTLQPQIAASASFDYYLFEEKYRGSWELINERQKKYVRNFSEGESVLDIGCGRGEFVSLMVDHGVKVVGIDMNKDMLSVAVEKGLPVFHADAQTYLAQIPDASLDGIFMSHVVEHIPTDQLVPLLGECYKKLKYNGRIILESPNPLSMLIFSNSFYLDPTHEKPVHPETLKFILTQIGFEISDTIYSGEIDSNEKLQLIQQNIDNVSFAANIETLNQNLEKLNNWLYGPQDYAVVAVR